MDRDDRHDQAEDLLKGEIVTDLVRLLSGEQQRSRGGEHPSLVCGMGRACGVGLVEELDEVVLVVEGLAESPQPRLESLTGRLSVDGLGGLTDDVDLIEIQRFKQLAATGEVAVERRHPDTGAPGDLCHRDLSVLLGESSAGDGEDLVTVALGLRAPGREGGCAGGHGSHCRTVYPESVLPLPDSLSANCRDNIVHATPVALVTGANKGIGLQIAKDLAAHDLTVLVGSRDLDRGEAAAKAIQGDARAVRLDVTDQSSITAAAERIRDELGRLDVLVNNAGISHAPAAGRSMEEIVQAGRLSAASLDEIRSVFETNVLGVIAVTWSRSPSPPTSKRTASRSMRHAPASPGPISISFEVPAASSRARASRHALRSSGRTDQRAPSPMRTVPSHGDRRRAPTGRAADRFTKIPGTWPQSPDGGLSWPARRLTIDATISL